MQYCKTQLGTDPVQQQQQQALPTPKYIYKYLRTSQFLSEKPVPPQFLERALPPGKIDIATLLSCLKT